MALFARARAASGDQLTAFELIPRARARHGAAACPGSQRPAAARASLVRAARNVVEPDATAGCASSLERFLSRQRSRTAWSRTASIAESGAQARELWRIREAHGRGAEIRRRQHQARCLGAGEPGRRFHQRAPAARSTAGCPGIRPIAFGHVGDGNIHFNLSQPTGADTKPHFWRAGRSSTASSTTSRASFNGSISAEHGIGRLKRDELPRYKSPLELDLMRRLKQALDPDDIMNPGKILPP